jgi:hypothetical protein
LREVYTKGEGNLDFMYPLLPIQENIVKERKASGCWTVLLSVSALRLCQTCPAFYRTKILGTEGLPLSWDRSAIAHVTSTFKAFSRM